MSRKLDKNPFNPSPTENNSDANMRKTAAAVTLVSALLISALTALLLVDSAKANGIPLTYLPEITIKTDGSIMPEMRKIIRTDNVYTLAGNLDGYVIVIERSNIIFDGAGYTIDATAGDNPGLKLVGVHDVTIKNLNVYGRYYTVSLYSCRNCLLIGIKADKRIALEDGCDSNTITKCVAKFLHIGLVGNGKNNLITKNNITQQLFVGGVNNSFSRNNFLLTELPSIYWDNIWDNGSLGNYWGNSSDWNPNASEIGNTGVSDTPYIIKRNGFAAKMYPNATNVDNYPLMYPFDIEKGTIAFPARELQPSPSLPPSQEPTSTPEPPSEPFPTTLVIASVSTVAVVGLTLLVYLKKRKR